jgi:imidazolonepropionase-like amidohydrolase
MKISDAPSADGVWHHCHLLPAADPAQAIRDGAIVVEQGRIAWIGAFAALPEQYRQLPRHDANGAWITPGLVDCHPHLVYGGQRADEFAMRLAGASYEEIARAGGGIVSTVRATREADESTLFAQASARLEPLLAEGVTAIEIKSGYGLSLEAERKQLRVARQLGEAYGVSVHTTFLGAHALPPEYAGRADDYIDLVCNTILLFPAGYPSAAAGAAAPVRRASGDLHRSQSGYLTHHFVAADDEHGVHVVPHDRARGAGRRDDARGARARRGGPAWGPGGRPHRRLRALAGGIAC